jgi:flagellar basal body-associated protein FliL
MKEKIWIVIMVLIVIAMLVIGPWIWWKNYHECRTQFSKLYCATRK